MIKPIPGLISLAFTAITSDQTKLLDSAAIDLSGDSPADHDTQKDAATASGDDGEQLLNDVFYVRPNPLSSNTLPQFERLRCPAAQGSDPQGSPDERPAFGAPWKIKPGGLPADIT